MHSDSRRNKGRALFQEGSSCIGITSASRAEGPGPVDVVFNVGVITSSLDSHIESPRLFNTLCLLSASGDQDGFWLRFVAASGRRSRSASRLRLDLRHATAVCRH